MGTVVQAFGLDLFTEFIMGKCIQALPSESSQFTKGGEEKPAAILQAPSAVTEKRGVVGPALRGAVWLPNQMD